MNFKDEIKMLIYLSIVHYIVIASSIYLSYLALKQYYFTSEILYGFIKYSFIFLAIFIIIPTLILILTPLYSEKIKIMNILKIICLSFIFISFGIGIIINLSIWNTSIEAKTFISYCPFHFDISLLNEILSKGNNKCKIKFCTFYSETESNPLPFNYICNYDSSEDLNSINKEKSYKRISQDGNEISSNVFIKCYKFLNIASLNNDILKNYLNLCHKQVFYKCELFEKPNDKDSTPVNNKESCPGKNYIKNVFLLATIYILIDIISYFFVFLLEYAIFKKITIDLLHPNNKDRDAHETVNSTIKNNTNNQGNNSNQSNNTEFKKEVTETIIVGGLPKNDELFMSQNRNEKEDDNNVKGNTKKANKNRENFKKVPKLKLSNITVIDSEAREINRENIIQINNIPHSNRNHHNIQIYESSITPIKLKVKKKENKKENKKEKENLNTIDVRTEENIDEKEEEEHNIEIVNNTKK